MKFRIVKNETEFFPQVRKYLFWYTIRANLWVSGYHLNYGINIYYGYDSIETSERIIEKYIKWINKRKIKNKGKVIKYLKG